MNEAKHTRANCLQLVEKLIWFFHILWFLGKVSQFKWKYRTQGLTLVLLHSEDCSPRWTAAEICWKMDFILWVIVCTHLPISWNNYSASGPYPMSREEEGAYTNHKFYEYSGFDVALTNQVSYWWGVLLVQACIIVSSELSSLRD